MDFKNTSDFVSGFWNIWVIGLSLVSIIGCAVFLFAQGKAKTNTGGTTGHVWDETLQEYSNPMPNWWRWLFYITVVFSLVYLALYPGLGNYAGSFGWSMRGDYEKKMIEGEAQFQKAYGELLKQDVMAVAANPKAKEAGHRLFLSYCAQCHGEDAQGSKGFPNLADGHWLWGGTPEKIRETITGGRTGMMIPKGTKPDMDAEQIKDVVAYVRSLAGLTADSIRLQRGKDLYPQACAACHGADAKGNADAGYPNLTLTGRARLYGSQEADMIETVSNGRTNHMPGFGEFLGAGKVHLLTAYVWGLGGGVKAEAKAAAPVAAAK